MYRGRLLYWGGLFISPEQGRCLRWLPAVSYYQDQHVTIWDNFYTTPTLHFVPSEQPHHRKNLMVMAFIQSDRGVYFFPDSLASWQTQAVVRGIGPPPQT